MSDRNRPGAPEHSASAGEQASPGGGRQGPLLGLRVVELAGLAPGPLAATVLADLGADVVRVDRPTSLTRNGGEMATGPAAPASTGVLGRGRRSVGLDLKDDADVAQLVELVRYADVLLEGFRPGVCERLGFGPDDCLRFNPRLVYARLTGWGQTGPYANQVGHDIDYLAVAGALSPLGPTDGPPLPPANYVADFGGGGMLAVVGILAALIERARSGYGQVVDAAMTEGVGLFAHFLRGLRSSAPAEQPPEPTPSAAASASGSTESGAVASAPGSTATGNGTGIGANTGASTGANTGNGTGTGTGTGTGAGRPDGNPLNGSAPFYRCYTCADGRFVAVGALEPQFYAALLAGLGLDEDERLPSQWQYDCWDELATRFAAVFGTRDRDEWTAVFAGTDACVAPVLELDEAPDHPQAVARGSYVRVDGDRQPAPAPRFSRTPGAVSGSAPTPGSGRIENVISGWRDHRAND